MATLETLTDRLLQERVSNTLEQFIHEHLQMGNDLNGIMAALAIATGEMYDRRMVQKWMDVYS